MRMKKFILTAVVSLFLFASIQVNAQLKEFGNVYYSVKNGDTWSGLTKLNATVKLEKPDKGEISPILITFEAKTADGKAFHKIVYNDPIWTGPSGSTKINWVFLNNSIHEIHASVPKPFDIELQFADGSAIKYYISPAY